MGEDQSYGAIVKNELTSNLPVTITTVLLGVVVLFAFAELLGEFEATYLLVGVTALFIPQIYDRIWPESYSTTAAVVWTVCAVLISTGVFIGILQIMRSTVSADLAAPIAFVATTLVQYGSAGLFARVRRNG
jgi:ABC-type protease/lipase transport system fused ATPase/permease subunit